MIQPAMSNIDFDTIDWTEVAKGLGISIPGQRIEIVLTRLDGGLFRQYEIGAYLVSTLIGNKLPIEFMDEQLSIMQTQVPMTTFDKACIKLFAKRILKDEGLL